MTNNFDTLPIWKRAATGVTVSKRGGATPKDLDGLLRDLSREAFPNDSESVAISKALGTAWGRDLNNESMRLHRTNMQTMGGHNVQALDAIRKGGVSDTNEGLRDTPAGQDLGLKARGIRNHNSPELRMMAGDEANSRADAGRGEMDPRHNNSAAARLERMAKEYAAAHKCSMDKAYVSLLGRGGDLHARALLDMDKLGNQLLNMTA